MLSVNSSPPRRTQSPRQPVSQPRQPAARPKPAAPKARPQPRPAAPRPQAKPKPAPPKSRPQPRPQPQPIAPRVPEVSPLPDFPPIESVPAYQGPSVSRQPSAPVAPVQPVAPAVQPIRPKPTDSYNEDPLPNLDDGTGINSDYDDADEQGYNYKVPPIEQQLIIERPKKRKPEARPSPTPRNDEFLDIEAPLPIYGAPPEPFDGGSSSFSNDILTPPVDNQEDALPGYLPPDPRIGRKSRTGRGGFGSQGRRGRRFTGFSKRVL